ncbi:methylaspartate mutase [Streptomyces litmocidini]|uniref:cobalamin B12-binding domain-containing protein n=1 Tax=Streptomyces litmocidini TaxID=67318 RepID=UPI0019B4383C|nr:cobalamin-dependent protein [Streptomyces litmocidini]GGV19638.1 methylaspartate mutase [Streptomyces litmocidini]
MTPSVGVSSATGRRGTAVVTGMASDSHTWNLVFLQLLLEENGFEVVNLGPCVPDDLLVDSCRSTGPDLVVISSVNGHGHQEGLRVIARLRATAELAVTPVVIGGKLDVIRGKDTRHAQRLTAAGFDEVFTEDARTTARFRRFLDTLNSRPATPPTRRGVLV